jgi:hypothetical protein
MRFFFLASEPSRSTLSTIVSGRQTVHVDIFSIFRYHEAVDATTRLGRADLDVVLETSL